MPYYKSGILLVYEPFSVKGIQETEVNFQISDVKVFIKYVFIKTY